MNMQQLPPKNRIADSFSRAARHYDDFAHFQRDVADRLLASIETTTEVNTILDIGSGTGYCATRLLERYPHARIVSLDIADAMLTHAKQKGNPERERWVCGDGEGLPFVNNSFDLIVSSLAMQWCHDPALFGREIHRVLKAGGRAFVSTLAENTLAELRASWSTIDSLVHVNSFLPDREISQLINALPFSHADIRHLQEYCYYPSFGALCRELKCIGAHNLNAGQARGLTGKEKVRQVKTHFESKAVKDKGVPVTWDLVLMAMVK